jgi:hypothetical protein
VGRRRTSAGGLAAAALLLAGCGSAHHVSADQRAAKATLQGYLTAMAHGSYGAACARLTPEAKTRIAKRSQAPTLQLDKTGCPAQLRALLGAVPGQQRGVVLDVLAGAKVASVTIDGDEAKADVDASFRGRTQSQTTTLEREGSAWKVDASPNPTP